MLVGVRFPPRLPFSDQVVAKWLDNNRAATQRVKGVLVGAFCLFGIDLDVSKRLYAMGHGQMVGLHFMV